MSNTQRFERISSKVLNALNRDFPGWQELVPEEKDSELNEESLITLLRNTKRAEFYRIIANRRNTLLKEIYSNYDKSLSELTQEFAAFSNFPNHLRSFGIQQSPILPNCFPYLFLYIPRGSERREIEVISIIYLFSKIPYISILSHFIK